MERQEIFPEFSERDRKHLEELERKKQIRRESRLKRIVEIRTAELRKLFPERADDFEVIFDPISGYESSIRFEDDGGDEDENHFVEIRPEDLPAYGFFLRLRSKPELKYLIEHIFRSDLDAKKTKFEMLARQPFEDNITEGVEFLSAGGKSK